MEEKSKYIVFMAGHYFSYGYILADRHFLAYQKGVG